MKYLKMQKFREVKVRIEDELLQRLDALAVRKDMSRNAVINDIIKHSLSSPEKPETNFTPSEKPQIFFQDGDITLLKNDFILLDTTDYEDKIDLIITSPPYNVNIKYKDFIDSISYEKYLEFSQDWLKKAFSILSPDGRICINIPLDKNKGGIQSVYADIVYIAKNIGFKYKTTIVWNEQNISRRTAWGSWLSASAPHVIAPVEMILVMYKNQWKKQKKGTSTITKEEFIEWTNGVWTFSGESKKRIGHPAPFPVELPLRCIKLFSFKEDTILDPFVGSGTTMVAAKLTGRRGIGIDISEDYLKIAVRRLSTPPRLF